MNYFNYFQENFYWVFPILIIDGILKAIALWKSARNNQLYWFVAIVIFNTVGILPVIYLLFFQKKVKG